MRSSFRDLDNDSELNLKPWILLPFPCSMLLHRIWNPRNICVVYIYISRITGSRGVAAQYSVTQTCAGQPK